MRANFQPQLIPDDCTWSCMASIALKIFPMVITDQQHTFLIIYPQGKTRPFNTHKVPMNKNLFDILAYQFQCRGKKKP